MVFGLELAALGGDGCILHVGCISSSWPKPCLKGDYNGLGESAAVPALRDFILPPPPSRAKVPPEEIQGTFNYWRNRLLWSTYFGYAIFYVMRKNLAAALPAIQADLGVSRTAFGAFFTLHDIMYGLSKFLAGILADRLNPRFLISMGMLFAAVANLFFGFSNLVWVLGAAWVVNGFFQGFGFPPCARILSYWFAPSERGVKWGIFNTSHQVGAFSALFLSGWLCVHYGWRSAFIVPAAIGAVTAVFLLVMVRDTPASLGLPAVEVFKGDVELASDHYDDAGPIGSITSPAAIGAVAREKADLNAFISKMVFRNPQIWLICVANFFVYVVRSSFLNWAPTYLHEVKGLPLDEAGFISGFYELAGLFGCLLGGWVTDRFLGQRRAPACVGYMILCAVFILLFWQTPHGHPLLDTLWLSGVGFSVYGPQFLVGVMMADLATKKAAGTAVGLSGLFGYMSGFFSGFGLSWVQTQWGWGWAFGMLMGSALVAVIPFAICWNSKPILEETDL